jgi:hypothetical protein
VPVRKRILPLDERLNPLEEPARHARVEQSVAILTGGGVVASPHISPGRTAAVPFDRQFMWFGRISKFPCETRCHCRQPIAALAVSRSLSLAVRSTRRNGYEFRSRRHESGCEFHQDSDPR